MRQKIMTHTPKEILDYFAIIDLDTIARIIIDAGRNIGKERKVDEILKKYPCIMIISESGI
jgi:hypothetical protein